MTKRVLHLVNPEVRRRAAQAVMDAPAGFVVTIAEPTRNTSQNAAMWPILEAFSEQLLWPVNGRMEHLTSAEWKDLLSAAFRKEQNRVAPGIDGGFVMLGQRTSTFAKKEFSDWLEFLHATAADRGVVVYQEEQAA